MEPIIADETGEEIALRCESRKIAATSVRPVDNPPGRAVLKPSVDAIP
jgi:hypothetical protein